MQKTKENEYVYDSGFHPKEVHLKQNYKFYRKDFWFLFWKTICIGFSKFYMWFAKRFVWGYKVIGKKNLRHQKGYVLISNHVHQFDGIAILTTLNFFRGRFYMTTLESNMGFGLVSTYFRYGGAVPIPTDMKLFKRFTRETIETLKKGKNVIVFPEAALIPFCDHIRPLLSGAFSFAIDADAKIIPTVLTFHKPKGLYKLTRRKLPCIHYNILEPYTITKEGSKKEILTKTSEDLYKIMTEYFNSHSDYYYEDGLKINENKNA